MNEKQIKDYPAIQSVRGLVWFFVIVLAILVIAMGA